MSEAEITISALEALLNLLVAGAAIAGAVAAFMGLDRWKKQKQWEEDSNLAQEILFLMFRHKDAIATVRHPAIWAYEYEDATDGAELSDGEEERRFKENLAVYEKRWQKASDVRAELYPLLIKSDVRWGPSFKDLFRAIHELEIELSMAVKRFLRAMNPSNSPATRRHANKRLEENDILYDTMEDEKNIEDDDFRKRYIGAFEPLEGYLRTKLGQRY